MTYKTRIKPYDHQRRALAKMDGMEAFALLMAMRTGKTKVALDHFGRLEEGGEARDFLLEAPAGVYHTWEEAIRTHASEDLLDRILVQTWESGAGNPARRRLDAFMRNQDPRRPRMLLVNAEALSRPGEARTLTREFLEQGRGANLMAIDESTLNKNPTAKRTKFNNRILAPLAANRLILSGLATPRSPLDLFSQFEFLDWEILGYKEFVPFRSHFAIMEPRDFGGRWLTQIVVGYKNVEELAALIEPYSFRVEFRPKIPSTWSTWEVDMPDEQRRIYEEIKEDACARLAEASHVSATVVITQMLRLHQVLCGHVVDDDGTEHEIQENRTSALMELLGDYAGKAVIWCSYDWDVRKVSAALEREYGEGSVARFWGGNVRTREAEEARFKMDKACRFEVATPGAGGKGRTWDVADLVVYYSSTDNLEHRDQSEQRVQGLAKKRQVDYVDLIVPNTVEGKILAALRRKINMAGTINGDAYREWLV